MATPRVITVRVHCSHSIYSIAHGGVSVKRFIIQTDTQGPGGGEESGATVGIPLTLL